MQRGFCVVIYLCIDLRETVTPQFTLVRREMLFTKQERGIGNVRFHITHCFLERTGVTWHVPYWIFLSFRISPGYLSNWSFLFHIIISSAARVLCIFALYSSSTISKCFLSISKYIWICHQTITKDFRKKSIVRGG